jgi:small subunit ribosomal protein S17
MTEPQAARVARKTRVGTVVSDKMQKTVVVEVERTGRHPLYGKVIRHSRRFKAHDEAGEAHLGDKVLIAETRPLSKDKRWRVAQVLERAR